MYHISGITYIHTLSPEEKNVLEIQNDVLKILTRLIFITNFFPSSSSIYQRTLYSILIMNNSCFQNCDPFLFCGLLEANVIAS